MLVLSGIYAVGRGVSKDNFNAYKWAYIVAVGSRVDEFRNGSRQLMGVLETRMTRDDVDRAKAEAGRWHATSSQPKPAVAPAPADTLTRDYQPSPQLSPAVSKQAPATTSNNSTVTGSLPGPRNTSEKKNDMDALLDRVPTGLRKRFGF
jgi:hypothetical protein